MVSVSVLCLVYTRAAESLSPGDRVFYDRIRPLFEKYCYDCHGGGKTKGDFALDKYANVAAMTQERDDWQLVLRNVRSSEMPPEKKPQPSPEERETILSWINQYVLSADCSKPDPGRVTVRRLNRAEYNNTIRDLVGIDFHPANDFPADDVGYGFDNIGDVLSLSPILFEKYLAAAEMILDRAIVVGGPKEGGPSQKLEAEQLPSTAVGGPYGNNFAMSLMREGEVGTNVTLKAAGDYFIRVRAFGQQAGAELPRMEVRLNDRAIATHAVSALEVAPATYETRLRLEPGEFKLTAAYINNYVNPQEPNPDLRDRNLFVDYLEVVGPLAIQPLPASHLRIFFQSPTPETTNETARAILTRFATRAFRRPPASAEMERLLGIATQAFRDGEPFESAVGYALQAVLISPHFLFRGEIQPEPGNATLIHDLNDYELASRLSYFLWSSMPDETLFALAAEGKLRAQLEPQVRRMLADPRSDALVKNFGAQWLQIRNLATAIPAKEAFPDFDDELRTSLERETELFFANIMRENRSVLEFLDADYTFVNERLARHYGLPAVRGAEFQKVSLNGSARGGVLTQGSILTITSNPTRTSPVKRGKWILENILGTPPPPPPPDVPELDAGKEATLSGSLRQRMEQHREKPVCASCHARMDPIGFGFENFDGVGRWRDKDGTFDIDPAGKLVSGESFGGPAGLKKILLGTKRPEYLRCLSEKMLTYALGRGLEFYDQCAIDRMVEHLEKDEFRFQTLVMETVRSVPFQKTRGEAVAAQ